jgi:hypothetical protein
MGDLKKIALKLENIGKTVGYRYSTKKRLASPLPPVLSIHRLDAFPGARGTEVLVQNIVEVFLPNRLNKTKNIEYSVLKILVNKKDSHQ